MSTVPKRCAAGSNSIDAVCVKASMRTLTRTYLLELGDAELELTELMSRRARRDRLMRSIVD